MSKLEELGISVKQIYVTTDGEEWETEGDAIEHQEKIDECVDDTYDHGIVKGDQFYCAMTGYVTVVEVVGVRTSVVEDYTRGKFVKEDIIDAVDLSKPKHDTMAVCMFIGKEGISRLKSNLMDVVRKPLQ